MNNIAACWAGAVAVAFASIGGASAGATFTLEQALAVTYENNPRLEQARADVRAADERVAGANAGWRPHIDANASYGLEQTRVFKPPPTFDIKNYPLGGGVNLNQSVFDFSTLSRIRQARALVQASRQQLMATEESVLFDAISAYLDVVRDEAVYALSTGNADVLRRQVEATREELKAGAVTRTDLNESQSRYAAAQRAVALASAQLAQSRNAFERAVGQMPENLDPSPNSPALPADGETAMMVALHYNPSLLQAVEQERASDLGVSVAAGQLLPRVSVSVGYRYDRDRYGIAGPHSTELGLVVTGQLTVPIYDGGASIAATREANNLHDRSKFAVIDTERAVHQAVLDAEQQLEAAKASVETSRLQVDASREAVEGVRQEQQAGERQILDILNAQQELFQAQVSLATAERDVVAASYRILLTMGRLTAKDLHLGVRLYDPEEHYDDAAGLIDFGG